MKVFITAKNEEGKKALLNLINLKRESPWVIRKTGFFSCTKLSDEPFKVEWYQKIFAPLPYSKPVATGIYGAMVTIVEEVDGKEEDVIIEVTK